MSAEIRVSSGSGESDSAHDPYFSLSRIRLSLPENIWTLLIGPLNEIELSVDFSFWLANVLCVHIKLDEWDWRTYPDGPQVIIEFISWLHYWGHHNAKLKVLA